MKDIGGTGGGERGNDRSHPRFDGRRKTRGGGPTARYGQKMWRTVVDISTGRIGGGGQGCCRIRNIDGDGVSNGGDNGDRRGMGGSSCNGKTRSGLRSISPRNSGRRRSRGTAAL